jgi:thiol-disulfide isomerase/thioredoxin
MKPAIRTFFAATALLVATFLAGTALFVTHAATAPPAPADFDKAPEFAGIEKWLNSEPLTVSGLRGKVVLVDFWTYTCINCVRTLPHVRQWYDKYRDKGLVVVGVHTPEYPFEKSTPNVEAALKRFDIRYPVAQDNSYSTWDAYRNQYWPALYLIDASGKIVYTHFGEGRYEETEAAIQKLLAGRK